LNWYCIIDLLLHLSLNVSNACSQTQILTRHKPIGSILSDDPSFSIRNVFPITIFFELSLAQSEKVIKYLCFVIISMSETRKHILSYINSNLQFEAMFLNIIGYFWLPLFQTIAISRKENGTLLVMLFTSTFCLKQFVLTLELIKMPTFMFLIFSCG